MNSIPANRTLLLVRSLTLVLALVAAWDVRAHQSSDGFLTLSVQSQRLVVRLDLAVRDLELLRPLDAAGDGKVTWGSLRSQDAWLKAYVQDHLHLTLDGRSVRPEWGPIQVARHADGAYAVLTATVDGQQPIRDLAIDYQILFEADRDHRGLVSLASGGTTSGDTVRVLSPAAPRLEWHPAIGTTGSGWRRMIGEGVHHIWTGYDHLLFLLALLLPSVARFEWGTGWVRAGSLRQVLGRVIRVVTAFTAAHSLTLAMAALGWARLPSRGVESVIALSVLAAALNNVWPVFRERTAWVAFAFGLIHGFGFAGALAELDLSGAALARGLVGFNLGVELGQLSLVALFLPIAFSLRGTWAYQRLALVGGSMAIALVSGGWLVERSLDLRFMPF